MVDILIVSVALAFLVFALAHSIRLLRRSFEAAIRLQAVAQLGLVVGFILVNAGFLWWLIVSIGYQDFFWLDRAVSVVLFFGGIFTAINTRLVLSIFTDLKADQEKLRKAMEELEKSKRNIEGQVARRVRQIARINKAMVGRELKMIELKKQLEELRGE